MEIFKIEVLLMMKCCFSYDSGREVEEDSEDEEAHLEEQLAELKEEERKALKR